MFMIRKRQPAKSKRLTISLLAQWTYLQSRDRLPSGGRKWKSVESQNILRHIDPIF